jgi:quercetin dioxygenase-like cupin family protein
MSIISSFAKLPKYFYNDSPKTDPQIIKWREIVKQTGSTVKELTRASVKAREKLMGPIIEFQLRPALDSDCSDVDFIVGRPGHWTEFGSSVYLRKIEAGELELLDEHRKQHQYNVFDCFMLKGSVLGKHRHTNHYETISVVQGKLRIEEYDVVIDDETKPFLLDKNTEHTVVALENTEFLVKFSPEMHVLSPEEAEEEFRKAHYIPNFHF